ncbi:phage virion morphogenesis protein [Flavobacterium endoglycinae]|uniref:Phage virion morphogenesis protein n=1 Tax=Flavobacterium endoglycinae TaxID=2816357 RepID=A0ABX7QJ58_9FLAO|nr:phage virion morphogenesis protein [Flavobacterium endoglycinae]QSW90715.1 phage virion morphogenesis protein [Flavobacterium endoglycinae]
MNDFVKMVDNLIKARKSLPNKVAVLAVRFSKERFRDQAWYDSNKEAWKARKRRREGGKRKSQTLLVNSGRLKRSIRKIEANMNSVRIGTDVPYAEIQNNGGKITASANVRSYTKKAHSRKAHSRSRKGRIESVSAHTVSSHSVKAYRRKMNTVIPARQFIGNSAKLASDIEKLVKEEMEKAMNTT